MFEKSKNITFTENTVKILSALNTESRQQLDALAKELCQEYLKKDYSIDVDILDNRIYNYSLKDLLTFISNYKGIIISSQLKKKIALLIFYID